MEETKRLLEQLHKDNEALRTDIGGLQGARRTVITALTTLAVALAVAAFFVVQSARYASCSTGRTTALSGPGNDRINLFFMAYTEAAGAIDHKLSKPEQMAVIAELDKDRGEFNLIPKHAVLVKQEDGNLLALRDLIKSIRANADYAKAVKAHPICSLWNVF